jgi:KDO2-lipid IV(A) lauroyltransferase
MSNKKNKISFASLWGYRLLYGVSWLVGLLPHWFLYYVVADTIYFLLYRVVRYRVGVVRMNLANSFPEKDERERRSIERAFYHNLSEYFVDAIDMASISDRERLRRAVWPDENRAALNRLVDGRNWVVMLGHYGSWEMLSTYGLHKDSAAMVSVYRPVSSRALDLYYRKVRRHLPDINTVPVNELLRYYVAHKDDGGRGLSVSLIADQWPGFEPQSWWVRFLNQPTSFFHGGEKIARKFSLPVYFMHVRKIRRGHWEQTCELIWDGVSPIADREITDRFAQMLEAEIRRDPSLWLWSHRRWKMQPWGEYSRLYNAQYGTNIPE